MKDKPAVTPTTAVDRININWDVVFNQQAYGEKMQVEEMPGN